MSFEYGITPLRLSNRKGLGPVEDGSRGFEEVRRDVEDWGTGRQSILLRFCLCVAGGCACGGNAIRRVVAGRDVALYSMTRKKAACLYRRP